MQDGVVCALKIDTVKKAPVHRPPVNNRLPESDRPTAALGAICCVVWLL